MIQSDLEILYNKVACEYDSQVKELIPEIDKFYTACFPIIKGMPEYCSLLDLGAGTGLFSAYIHKIRPEWTYSLVDFSEEMLEVAKKKFKEASNFEFHKMDYLSSEIPGNFDVILSGLSIHYLEDKEKEKQFDKIFKALNYGGIFINADLVSGRTPGFDSFYKTAWREKVLRSDLEEDAVKMAFRRSEKEKLTSLEQQLQMLENAGFSEVDCFYKHLGFAVIGSSKGNLSY